MGRIADALRRAEKERRLAADLGPSQFEGAVALAEPPGLEDSLQPVSGDSSAPIEVVREGLSESLVPFFERSSLITEQYRSLRTRLLSQNPQYEHRVLAVTSAVPKEGKSVTTLNLGCILAEIKHLNVLVVDADFRRSTLARMLNEPDGPGLAELLKGEAAYPQVLRPTPYPNLRFLSAGKTRDPAAAQLLTAAAAASVFKRFQNDFHYTIVDTPPATTVTDVGIIGQMCSGVIVIVRLHRTDEVAAKRCVRLLQVNNVPIVGCLLIGRDLPLGRYGYGYGYGYGNRYYRYYDYHKKPEEVQKSP